MLFRSFDPQDTERETYGNQKTDEFIRRFTQAMDGVTRCRDILGQDISKAEGMAAIRREGLILQKCPRAINISIEILEDMLADYLKDVTQSDLELKDIPQDNEMYAVLKEMGRLRCFRRSVNNLLLSSEKRIGFIQFDIRKFKIVNDLYGEKFGNEVLDFIRKQLQEICSDGKLYVNLRSDVFMVVMEYGEEAELKAFIRRLNDRIKEFKEVKLQMSYGVYTVEDREMELRQMEDRAAMARKTAKESIIGNIVFYREQFKDSLYNRRFIEENMQAAITQRQYLMYLQPKYSIEKNEITGAEALVRWRHPERGMIYPDQFIPILEENGFIRSEERRVGKECRL